MTSTVILIIAAILDYLIADPINWLHPVQVMGWIISGFSKLSWRFCQTSSMQRLAGIFLGIVLIIGSSAIAYLIIQLARLVNPLLGIVIESILLASCFAAKSLRNAAETVLEPLISGDIERSRLNLSQFVGRDTENLSTSEILRAVLETVTENATDGVMAPLFYAIIGGLIPGVGSAPLALAYKASSTLDSMVGYKEAPYTDLGWFSAKTEDFLTWFPCRLTVVTLALISGKPMQVWQLCDRDATKDPSPNSGWSECAYAAILGVQMGGSNSYKGVIKHKPLLGDNNYPIQPETIHQALQLTQYCFLLWLGVAASLLLITAIRQA
ncbi:MAG: cobalamin biosynthesis protein [Methylacidiphilales bacterium]|nr:cobalamin biosynthesis protein [Candidatus Methylacidiphilales bacterium]NJR16790.1 cobalamin biosynthesis protein [Calothrix sp. CSU_2_0]